MKKNLVKYFNIFLSLILVLLMVSIFFFIKGYALENAKKEISPSEHKPQPSNVPVRALGDYAVIYKRNLFNMNEPLKPVAAAKPLSLDLKGTVVGSEEFTFCIIEDKTKRDEELYQKGDKIQNMEITEITANSVVLMQGPNKTVLYIEEEQPQPGETSVTSKREPEPELNILSDVEQESPNEWVISRQDFLSAANNVSQILKDFKIKPNFSDGKMAGFKIDDMKDDSLASAVGIEKGDIVRKINGETIDSPKKIFDFYRNMSNTDSIQLEVERDGKTEVLTYKIKP